MSATAKVLEAQPVAAGGRHRPTLRLVRSPHRTAPRLPFVAVVVAVLSIGLVGLLLLSMQRGQASFRQSALATTNATLADQVQALQRSVENDRNPGVLGTRARALGMVPETDPGYLDARGQIIGPVPSGDPRPAKGAKAVDGVVVAGHSAAPVAAPVPAPVASAPTTAVVTKPTAKTKTHATTTAKSPTSAKPKVSATTAKTDPTPTTSRSAR